MDSAKNVRRIILFKKFGMVRVNKQFYMYMYNTYFVYRNNNVILWFYCLNIISAIKLFSLEGIFVKILLFICTCIYKQLHGEIIDKSNE